VLLLDEPSAPSTPRCASNCASGCARFHEEIGVTSILVTHDQEEAFEVADQVVVMNHGKIEQVGTAAANLRSSRQRVRQWISRQRQCVSWPVEHGKAWLGDLQVEGVGSEHNTDSTPFYVRPHELDIERIGNGGLQARVVHVNPAGPVVRVELVAIEFGMPILVELSQAKAEDLRLKVGETVFRCAAQGAVLCHRSIRFDFHKYQPERKRRGRAPVACAPGWLSFS